VKKLILLGIMLAGIVLLGVSHVVADTDTPNNEVTTNTGNSSASENIYALKIENINKNGADFYWSTSIETKGSIEYAYTKLAQLYNPQSPGSQQDVLVTVVPARVKSEPYYVKEHHIRVDNLDMSYDPFVQYTIKSETFSGEVYTLSGELVLVDTGVLPWWHTLWFTIGWPIGVLVLGRIIELRIRKHFQSRKAKKRVVPLD
jgi:hypothetical protein